MGTELGLGTSESTISSAPKRSYGNDDTRTLNACSMVWSSRNHPCRRGRSFQRFPLLMVAQAQARCDVHEGKPLWPDPLQLYQLI
jgi:hypothetical protein